MRLHARRFDPDAAGRLFIGWDIGGAHVKAACWQRGRLREVRQWPCALWHGLPLLDAVLDDAFERWPAAAGACHAVTMTGEMVDLFEDREQGVLSLAAQLAARLGPDMRFYGVDACWIAPDEVAANWRMLASANWSATAGVVAERIEQAVLVDIGSSTTDLVPVAGGQVLARGRDDAQRLHLGELVYQGVVRTPLCALAQRVTHAERDYYVMNEWFATTADVYRLTRELDPAHDQHPAADGGPKDLAGSCRRLARMIGHDARDASLATWTAFAHEWRTRQLVLIAPALRAVIRAAELAPAAPLVGAGCGHFLVRDLATLLDRPYVGFDALAEAAPPWDAWARVCAPAVSVAMLRAQAGDETAPRAMPPPRRAAPEPPCW